MNRSGHKADPFTKKDNKSIEQNKGTKGFQSQAYIIDHNSKLSTTNNSKSKLSFSKHSKKLASNKLKQPASIYQQTKSQSPQNKPSKQSSYHNPYPNNDYCVNQYFVNGNKFKNIHGGAGGTLNGKDEKKTFYRSHTEQNQIYHHYHHNDQKGSSDIQVAEPFIQEYGFETFGQERNNEENQKKYELNTKKQNSKFSSIMKKMALSQKRALITAQGKIVSVSKEKQILTKDKQKRLQQQLNKSNSQNTLSFSTQYINANKQKKGKSKSKSKIKSKSKSKLKSNHSFRSKQVKQIHKDHSQKLLKVEKKHVVNKASSNQKVQKVNKKHIQQKPFAFQKANIRSNRQFLQPQRKIKTTKKQLNHSKNHSSQKNQQSKQTIISHTTTNYQNTDPHHTSHYNNRYFTIIDSSRSLSTTQGGSYYPEIDLEEIFHEIQNQQNSVLSNGSGKRDNGRIIIKNVSWVERMKCVSLIGKVCGELKAKRETFFLSVCIFDKYLFTNSDYTSSLLSNQLSSNMKSIALTSIIIALKIDCPQLLPKYCLSFRPNPQVTIKKTSFSINKLHKKKKSQISLSHSQIKQKDSFLDTKDKLTFIITQPMYQNQKQEDFHIGEIMDLEVDLMCKMKFKLYFKTYAYWSDLFTSLWDNYILERNLGNKLNDKEDYKSTTNRQTQQPEIPPIFFRRTIQSHKIKSHKDFKLFSYLNQISQSIIYFPQAYKFKPSTLILSIMYLLIRINIQQKKSLQPLTIYKNYRQNLQKSCNIIFCDSTGINQIFGNFLLMMNLNMSHILECIQFISRFFQPEYLKIWNYDGYQCSEMYEEKMSVYYHNEKLVNMVKREKEKQ